MKKIIIIKGEKFFSKIFSQYKRLWKCLVGKKEDETEFFKKRKIFHRSSVFFFNIVLLLLLLLLLILMFTLPRYTIKKIYNLFIIDNKVTQSHIFPPS